MTSLLAKAMKKVNKGAAYTYYMHSDRANPVFEQFEHDINDFVVFIKQKQHLNEKSSSRVSTWLFDMWKKYDSRLPALFFKEKVIEIGEFLISASEFKLALWLCFDRHLLAIKDTNFDTIVTVDDFKQAFFSEGFSSDESQLTIRALVGRNLCIAELIFITDPRLQNPDSIDKSIQILYFVRLMMQCVLPYENLYWLVFNGTIHIYSITRHLVAHGYSEKALEFLIWAALSMETSAPLLDLTYISWRSTLYTAVCQAYTDCGYGKEAQNFGKRALQKINELRQADNISSSEYSLDNEALFKEACVKIAVVLFKQTVLTTKQRTRNIFRPKQRADLKTVRLQPWPRTTTEKLLSEMFRGASAQFLCIIETLTEPSRRLLQSSPPGQENEVEILDLYDELFLAAQDIVSGGGGNPAPIQQAKTSQTKLSQAQKRDGSNLKAVCLDQTLIELASEGLGDVSLSGVIKLVKLSYNWEIWDVFEVLVNPVMEFIEKLDPETAVGYQSALKELELLILMSKMNRSFRLRQQQLEKLAEQALQEGDPPIIKAKPQTGLEKLLSVADFLLSLLSDSKVLEKFDVDLIIDSALYLWKKCKSKFSKSQFLHGMENAGKWVYLLDSIYQILRWCNFSTIDPVLTGELALRLSLILESSSSQRQDSDAFIAEQSNSPVLSVEPSPVQSPDPRPKTSESLHSIALLKEPVEHQLLVARETLANSLTSIARARQLLAKSDGTAIADVSWDQDINRELFDPNLTDLTADDCDEVPSTDILKDLHVELLFTYHRICLRLQDAVLQKAKLRKREIPSISLTDLKVGTEKVDTIDQLTAKSKNNELSKSLLLAQKSVFLKDDATSKSVMQEASKALKMYQNEQRILFLENTNRLKSTDPTVSKTPPSPILLSITDGGVIFKPAPFQPTDGTKVAYYRIFAKKITDKSSKVRLSDYKYPGTGEFVPSTGSSIFTVTGLDVGQRYSFALAAYSAEGDIIGSVIGQMTKPILIFTPLSILMAWSFVCQAAYHSGVNETAVVAFDALWKRFIASEPDPTSPTYTEIQGRKDTLHKFNVNRKILERSSPILIRQFIFCLFIRTQISIRQTSLFCDQLSDNGPLRQSQLLRISECERMMVALDLSSWLNDMNFVLQSITVLYGLVSPLIYFRIRYYPLLQTVQRILSSLLELPAAVRQHTKISENMNHLTAVAIYSVARTLRDMGERSAAADITSTGVKLLSGKFESIHSALKLASASTEDPKELRDDAAVPSSAKGKKGKGKFKEDAPLDSEVLKKDQDTTNPELKALEIHLGRHTKPAGPDFELSGHEDPSILYAYIAYLPSKTAYREVVKFKRRPRFLEFFTQVLQKAVSEDLFEIALEWIDDTMEYYIKRNETIAGVKSKFVRYTVMPTPPQTKTYKAQVAEFSKDDRDRSVTPRPDKEDAKDKKKPKKVASFNRRAKLRSYENLPENARAQAEARDLAALDKLAEFFPPFFVQIQRRRKFRALYVSELPWISQVQLLTGISHFRVFTQRLAFRDRISGDHQKCVVKSTCLFPDILLFDNGSLLNVDVIPKEIDALDLETTSTDARIEEWVTTGELKKSPEKCNIELVAIATADAATIPTSTAPTDTPRTYRSDWGTKKDKDKDQEKMIQERRKVVSDEALVSELQMCLDCIRRAIVLSDRGQLNTQLFNACLTLWNTFNDLAHLTLCVNTSTSDPFITIQGLRKLVLPAFCLAADAMLDLLQRFCRSDGKFSPFCNGTVQEKGSSNLHFDRLLDNQFPLNFCFIRKFVMRTLDLLFFEEKWEKVVHYSLRFNALTNDRYISLTGPLLVFAQRQLICLLQEHDGKTPPQKHYQELMKRLEKSQISSVDYVTHELIFPKIELPSTTETETPDKKTRPFSPSDPQTVISVPIDPTRDLKSMKMANDKGQFYARAVQHCRKLLTSFLSAKATDQTVISSTPPVAPISLTNEDVHRATTFASKTDVEQSPMSNHNAVVEAYNRAIELAVGKKQHEIVAQLYRELGCLYLTLGDRANAKKHLSMSSAAILDVEKFISCPFDEAQLHWLQEKCGICGCLMLAVNASNTAEYLTATSNIKARIKYTLFAYNCYLATLRSSLPHPQVNALFATYEIKDLVPGVDLFSDKWRMDERVLLSSLQFCSEELSRAGYQTEALPILSLCQYVASIICRDISSTIRCKIFRIKVLSDLHLFSEAFSILMEVLHGEKLPQQCLNVPRNAGSRSPNLTFDNAKGVLDQGNLDVLEYLVSKRISFELSTLYGPFNTSLIAVSQTDLIVKIADSIVQLPTMSLPSEGAQLKQRTFTKNKRRLSIVSNTSKNTNASATGKTDRRTKRRSSKSPSTRQLIQVKPEDKSAFFQDDPERPVTESFVRDILLSTAETRMATVLDAIINDESPELTLFEIEIVSRVYLCLAEVSLQRQHGRIAAYTVLQLIKLLQKCSALSENGSLGLEGKEKALCGYSVENDRCQNAVSANMWLQCHHVLVRGLVMELKVPVTDPTKFPSDIKVIKELDSAQSYCEQGVENSRKFAALEYESAFLWQLLQLNIIEGKSLESCVRLLEKIVKVLDKVNLLSNNGKMMLVKSLLMLSDYTKSKDVVLKLCSKAHDILIDSVAGFGQPITRFYKTNGHETLPNIQEPVQNIYLLELRLLAHAKLRIAKCLFDTKSVEELTVSLDMLDTSRSLNLTVTKPHLGLNSQIWYLIGKINKAKFLSGEKTQNEAISGYLEAIKVSSQTVYDIKMVQECYTHIASILIRESSADPKSNHELQVLQYLVCAAAAGNARRSRRQMVGNDEVTTKNLTDDNVAQIPEFAAVDVTGEKIVGEMKKVYANEIEVEMAPLTEALRNHFQ